MIKQNKNLYTKAYFVIGYDWNNLYSDHNLFLMDLGVNDNKDAYVGDYIIEVTLRDKDDFDSGYMTSKIYVGDNE